MKAIETSYRGCRFRSRLEARWAVFFDALGVAWEYEKEGFELEPVPCHESCFDCDCKQHLGFYLPDFWLPALDGGIWFEVKGEAQDADGLAVPKLCRLAKVTGKGYALASGQIPDPDEVDYAGHPNIGGLTIESNWDLHYSFCSCPWCGKVGLQYDARGARVCGWRSHFQSEPDALAALKDRPNCWRADDKCYTGDDPKILAAYRSARSARFEHGETPDVGGVQ